MFKPTRRERGEEADERGRGGEGIGQRSRREKMRESSLTNFSSSFFLLFCFLLISFLRFFFLSFFFDSYVQSHGDMYNEFDDFEGPIHSNRFHR